MQLHHRMLYQYLLKSDARKSPPLTFKFGSLKVICKNVLKWLFALSSALLRNGERTNNLVHLLPKIYNIVSREKLRFIKTYWAFLYNGNISNGCELLDGNGCT